MRHAERYYVEIGNSIGGTGISYVGLGRTDYSQYAPLLPYTKSEEIIMQWRYLEERCPMDDIIVSQPITSNCLNQQITRPENPIGAIACESYYIWGPEAKSRVCILKSATETELSKYSPCGTTGAFVCSKETIENIAKVQEFRQHLSYYSSFELKNRKMELKTEYLDMMLSNQTFRNDEKFMDMALNVIDHNCIKKRSCASGVNEDILDVNMKCRSFFYHDQEVKFKACVVNYEAAESMNLYQDCELIGVLVCLK